MENYEITGCPRSGNFNSCKFCNHHVVGTVILFAATQRIKVMLGHFETIASPAKMQSYVPTSETCELLILEFGFVPMMKPDGTYDKDAGFTSIENMMARKLPIPKVKLMGVMIPQAFRKLMTAISDLRDILLDDLFDDSSSLEEESPKSSIRKFVPKELRNLIPKALAELQPGRCVTNVLYIYIYELLGMPLCPKKMIFHGDVLLEKNFRNECFSGRFGDWRRESFSMSISGSLSEIERSYITPSMTHAFNLS
jgi:hypothetical protein